MTTLLRNISSLIQTRKTPTTWLKGAEMADLPSISNAYLLIKNGEITDFGPMINCPERADQILDLKGQSVLPTWCDSHTHIVFAAYRQGEFVDRIKGLSYQDIALKGGGILNSAKKLNETPFENLVESALERLNEVQEMGTGAIEIKSGYGLSLEGELKMLRVIQELKKHTALTIKATFLGAHALPTTYKTNRKAYIDLLIKEMLPIIAEENLADYIDAFCEKNYFTPEETEQLIIAGDKYGLKAKIHTNQFNCLGGIEACVKNNALTVDHLEVLTLDEMKLLANSKTLPVLLPSAPFFINDVFPPAREMLNQKLGFALASDYNPGSTPSGNMSFVLSLACIKLRLLPEEALNASTINGAFAMEVEQDLGTIAIGKKANLIITKPIPDINYLPYAFGSNWIDKVCINGEISPS